MGAVNVQVLNSGDKTYLAAKALGQGAIAAGDALITDVVTYPQGSEYYDTASRITYRRNAVAGVIGDWSASAAGTVLA